MSFSLAPVQGVQVLFGLTQNSAPASSQNALPANQALQAATGNDSPQSTTASANQGNAPAGIYEVADTVVLQAQLQSVATGNGNAGGQSSNAALTTGVNSTAASQLAAAASSAVNGTTTAATAANSASSVQSQETQLQAALQALGLSPAVIQEFMTIGRLLAQIAPSVFQNFVTQMIYLAKNQQNASSAPAAGANTPASTAQSGANANVLAFSATA